MASFTSQAFSFGPSWNYDTLKNFGEISPMVQRHLKLVYLALCCSLASSAVGAYLHVMLNIGGLLTFIGCILSIGWLFSVNAYEERKRFGILMGVALLQGATLGPIIKAAIDFDSSILVAAFAGTALAFGCFSAAAMVARRREFLYLGGLLSSGFSILLLFQFGSSLFGFSETAFKIELYYGLVLFMGYIIFDTQDIIERAHSGDLDYIKHALTLFTDFVAVLVRVLIIMMKNASEKEDKKKKRRC
ncbi:Bax inhibitor 1 [Rhynchospora pubera]|uniref:Bax inhibitor 1 n=1 Tax=Rhynchospora pubera TaxID=906938 RepID=A0AAV8GM46_9POAL|nr:Bax inhibitor 1 [Rhynchospora pubera]